MGHTVVSHSHTAYRSLRPSITLSDLFVMVAEFKRTKRVHHALQ